MSTASSRRPGLRVALSGGGSGGHVYPALAVAGRLQASPGPIDLMYVGTLAGLEADLVPRSGVAFHAIHAAAWLKPGAAAKLRGAWHTARGTWDAWRLFARTRPDVLLTTGGYVTGPVGLAASWLHIPLVVHEQNVWPGLTNRLLARRAHVVLTTYADTAQHLADGTVVRVTGYPVRTSVVEMDRDAARRQLGLAPEWVVVVATGGSQGAPAVNTLMADVWAAALERRHWAVIWATGPRRFETATGHLDRTRDPERLRVEPYLYDLDVVLAAADVVVGRAGAGTLAEAAARALPLVLVPSPHVSEHHQEKNAAVWADRGAALVVAEAAVGHGGLSAVAALMDDADRRRTMGQAASRLHHPAALDRIVAAVADAAGSPRGRRM